MAEFTASPDVSSFTPPNQLFDLSKSIQGAQAIQQNQLAQQGQQTALTQANVQQVSQAAAGLLSAYPDEASRAAAYPKYVGLLQSQGYAMNAPAQYPGEAALRAMVNMGLSPKELYASGALLTPQQQQAFNTPTPPAGGGGGTSTPAAGGGPAPFVGANLPLGVTPDVDQLVRPVYGEARGEPTAGQIAVANVIKTRMQKAGQGVQDTVFAPNQFEAWSDPKNRPGMEALSPTDPQYQAILNNVVRPTMSGQAQDPTGGATYFFNPKLQAQLGRQTPGFAQGNQTTIGNHTFYYGPYGARGGTATASAAPSPAPVTPGGGVTPAPYQVASNAPVAPPGAAAAPTTPVQTPATGDQFDVPAAAAPAQPAPPVPAPGAAAQPPAATPTPAARGGTSSLPDVSTIPTGYNSPAYQAAQQTINEGYRRLVVAGSNEGLRLQAQAMIAQGQRDQQLDHIVQAQRGGIPGNFNTTTGQFTPDPSRRMAAQQNGDVINDQGQVIYHVDPQELVKDANNQYWYLPKYPTQAPGGGLAGAQSVPGPQLPTPGYVKEQEAEADRLSKMRDAVLDRAKESAAANTMIGNTETAMSAAQQGNVGPGALAPKMVELVATAKALGINLAGFGIDTSKLAAAQVTREQLQQLNGAILRKMYPQRITNADLAVSGTVLPNYGLDPDALTANFDIYKKQNAYDTQMAQDMLAYEHANNGSLKGWEQQWYSKNNFATGPLDNLFGDAKSGQLSTGKGDGGGQTQAAPTLPPKALASLTEGHVSTFLNGQQWTLRGGQPVQVK